MQVEIQAYSDLLARLDNAKNIQFIKNIINEAGHEIEAVAELVGLYDELTANWQLLDTVFMNNKTVYETRALASKDGRRDYTMRSLASRVSVLVKYPQSEEERIEALRLKFIISAHKNVEKQEYEAETTFFRAIISELRQYESLLVKYHIKEIVDRLEQENSEFDELYNTRNQIRTEQHSLGNGLLIRKATTRSFSNICKAITGMMLIPTPTEVKARLERIIGTININLDQYNEIYHRHVAIVARHRKKNAKKADTATQTPAGNPQPASANAHPEAKPKDLNPPATNHH